MLPQLKEVYGYLRGKNILTHGNLTEIVTAFSACIPYGANKSDIEKWGWPNSTDGPIHSSVDHILTYLGNRLTWMDTQLL